MKTTELVVSRTIPASAAEVFDVWLDPESPGGPWFGPTKVILDAKVDGLFYHSVVHEGRSWAHYGRFLEIERPRRVAHTWMSEATRGLESVLTVTFEPRGDDTEVTIRHTNVPDDDMGRQHADGWSWVLSALVERFGNARAAKP